MIWLPPKTLCRLIHASGLSTPIVLVLTEGGFTVVNSQWGISDVVVSSASPAEVEARLRLVSERGNSVADTSAPTGAKIEGIDGQIRSGDLLVDTNGYTASLHGRPIDLAYKEFELLKYLVQHPGRVFTRAQLLQEVWGYDYYGGTRTVDVHIRRLRAARSEYEHLIGTVPVGYRSTLPKVNFRTMSPGRRRLHRCLTTSRSTGNKRGWFWSENRSPIGWHACMRSMPNCA